jgi:hypothetical protein
MTALVPAARVLPVTGVVTAPVPAARVLPVTRVGAVLVLAAVVASCTSLDRPRVQPDVVPMATPLRTFAGSMASTITRVEAAVTAAGERFDGASRPYRPSEPQTLLEVPRAVLRVGLADPDDGFVVVYQGADPEAANTIATELAGHLGSGFGQTNYPADTRFSVTVVGDTVVFTSFSPGRSSDPERAQRAFDAIARVGRAVEVRG